MRGMKTFVYDLYWEGRISQEEAPRNADLRNDLSLRIRLDSIADEAGIAG